MSEMVGRPGHATADNPRPHARMPPSCHSAEGEAEEAFSQAVERGAVHELRRLVSERLCDARTQPDLLFVACENGHADVARFLLEAGVGVNQQLANGTTPLHVACNEGGEAVVSVLLQFGADVDALMFVHPNLGALGCVTPLYTCCGRGHASIAALLIAAKADANVPLLRGRSPLHVAVSSGHTETVHALLQSTPAAASDRPGAPLVVSAAAAGQPARIPLVLQQPPCAQGAATAATTAGTLDVTDCSAAPAAATAAAAAAAAAAAVAAAATFAAAIASASPCRSASCPSCGLTADVVDQQLGRGREAQQRAPGSEMPMHLLANDTAMKLRLQEELSSSHVTSGTPGSSRLEPTNPADLCLIRAMESGELTTLREALEEAAPYASPPVLLEARETRDTLRAKERRAAKKASKAAAKEDARKDARLDVARQASAVASPTPTSPTSTPPKAKSPRGARSRKAANQASPSNAGGVRCGASGSAAVSAGSSGGAEGSRCVRPIAPVVISGSMALEPPSPDIRLR